ncbi:capsular biosynthesis protein [Cupriavidus gilardii]|jgi:capsular polysaccharide export protein|nr:capsular biosynthesis protein [Cupriavidus gilardii]
MGFHRLLQYKHVLLLQGPNGPFFARLRNYLQAAGRAVTKVNFNAGDDLFYRGGTVVRFKEPMPEWDVFLRRLILDRQVDAVVVFGSSRRHHRIAARVASELGIAFWVFEEGYVRPDYITLEANGVNADSPLVKLSLDQIPEVPRPLRRQRFENTFRKMAWHSFLYFAAGVVGQKAYPHYRHHKPFGLHEAAQWIRAGVRRVLYAQKERDSIKRLLADDHPPFFLVALQVYNDSQIRVHSPWKRMDDFIEWVVYSFANYAPSDAILVVKHHPMDRGHTNYAVTIANCAARFGAIGRVLYLHDAHLPSLLHHCRGLVTVNSTAGLQALYHRVPVIALGRCFYAKAGLTYQGSIDAFWTDCPPVDTRAFTRFRNNLIHSSQINSSFYADTYLIDVDAEPSGVRRFYLKWFCALCLIVGDLLGTNQTALLPLKQFTSGLINVFRG